MLYLKNSKIGKPPQDRNLAESNQANQWTVTPKQLIFAEYWLSSNSTSFGNAYQSAIRAGYSHNYARIITAQHTNLEWLRDAKRRLVTLEPEHITLQLQDMAMNAREDSIKLLALDKLAKIQGMYSRKVNTANFTFVNNVPRPKVEKLVL